MKGATAVLNFPASGGSSAGAAPGGRTSGGSSSSTTSAPASRGRARVPDSEKVELECLDDRVLEELLAEDKYNKN
ncbi:hypothetical protein Zm00014a_030713 [Zea mays]|uniref:Uncharacterized protein n=3 Tax=Zea mays TaxID=4577 RepID=A0A8J8XC59_MAIZE|nr:hypothetical protein ZEAMMB73_Zm00001d027687 [Zea mays]PWZ57135.1 hypothetical protein Zm00014a_030713 [Zea mays]